MMYNVELVAHAFVRSTIRAEASSKEEAMEKVKRQLEVGDEPGVQLVSDVVWIYDGLDDSEDIQISSKNFEGGL